MKILKIVTSLLLLCIFPNLGAQTIKTVDANPINVAVKLMQRTDTASMASACSYYGYTRQLSQDGYTVFTHPNGSTIRYANTNSNQMFPSVELTSKVSAKERDQIFQNLKFEKIGNSYEQKSIGYSTRCQIGPHGTLILTRVMKKKE